MALRRTVTPIGGLTIARRPARGGAAKATLHLRFDYAPVTPICWLRFRLRFVHASAVTLRSHGAQTHGDTYRSYNRTSPARGGAAKATLHLRFDDAPVTPIGYAFGDTHRLRVGYTSVTLRSHGAQTHGDTYQWSYDRTSPARGGSAKATLHLRFDYAPVTPICYASVTRRSRIVHASVAWRSDAR